jgi:adenylate cyclase
MNLSTCKREDLNFGTTRIGINTGRAIVGNFGGATRFDYTAHGDAINTAARLEAANKVFGTTILISKATRDAVPAVVARPLGKINLRGKGEATEVFEPLDADHPGRGCLERLAEIMKQAEINLGESIAALKQLIHDNPADAVLARILARFDSRVDNVGNVHDRQVPGRDRQALARTNANASPVR